MNRYKELKEKIEDSYLGYCPEPKELKMFWKGFISAAEQYSIITAKEYWKLIDLVYLRTKEWLKK